MTASRIAGTTWTPEEMEWASRGSCRDVDPDQLFVAGAAQHQAKVICKACPVKMRCLADALDGNMQFGVWGGMTERERRMLLRRRPDVSSWRHYLASSDASAELMPARPAPVRRPTGRVQRVSASPI